MNAKRPGRSNEEEAVTKKQRTVVSMGSWRSQLSLIESSASRDQVIEAYTTYLNQYVNDGLIWSKYINYLLKGKTIDTIDKSQIESIFSKTLTKIYNVDLWKSYLTYIQLINPITPDSDESTRQTVIMAFQFAVDTIGMDPLNGGEIWNDFLKYLYHWQCVTSQESIKRQELIQKLLLKLITIPSPDLEDHWKIFTGFENDINTTNLSKARKVINEQSSNYMKLRSINNDLKKIIVNPKLKEITERSSQRLYNQLHLWNDWIQWEYQNNLNLNEKLVQKRINLVYNLSCQYCRLLPEAWFNYANYIIIEQKNLVLGKEILIDSLKINPNSLSLTIKLSNIYESNNEVDNINELWKSFIENLIKNQEIDAITYCYITWMKIMKRLTNIKQVRQVFSQARKYENINYTIYIEYALIEHSNNDNKIAIKAFELGLKYFPKSIQMLLSYLNFLIDIKDLTNFKKIIELSLDNFNGDDLIQLFIKYYQVESNYGNLNSINLLTKRYLKKFPESTSFDLLLLSTTNKVNFNPLLKLDQYKSSSIVDNINDLICKRGINKDSKDDDLNDDDNDKNEFVIPDEIYNLLRVLPNSEYYSNLPTIFDVDKTMTLFKSFDHFANESK